jgi:nucleoside-diphosphate-sugar epimerase
VRNILVCGATGFIGRNLAEALADRPEFEVFATHFRRPALDHPRIHPVSADLTDQAAVERVTRGMDVIIQAAATTSGARDILERPYIHVADNAVMNSLLLRAAFEHAVEQFVFFSCSVMYPSASAPIAEAAFDAGSGMHPSYFGVGWTKVYIEQMCEFYARLGRTRHTVIRHSNIFGPHDKFDLERSHVLGATIAKVMQSQGDAISVWGAGNEARDLLYIDDLVDFVALAIERQAAPFELVNIGSGVATPVRSLVEKIIAASGKKLRIDNDLSRPSIDTTLCLDTARAQAIFGWMPKITLEEGIRRTLTWYEKEFPSLG